MSDLTKPMVFTEFNVVMMNQRGILLMGQERYIESIACFNEGLKTILHDHERTHQIDGGQSQMLSEQGRNKNNTEPSLETLSFTTSDHNVFNNKKRRLSFETAACTTRQRPAPVSTPPHRTSINNRRIYSIQLSQQSSLPQSDKAAYDNDTFAIFDRPLHISPDLDELKRNASHYNHILSAILTFNVGLAHHLIGLRRGSSIFLSSSLEFYSMTYQSITYEDGWLNHHKHYLSFVLLALANNIGHIHAHYHNIMEAGVCNDELSLRLTAESQAAADAQCPPIATNEQYRVFFQNACFFRAEELIGAPAA